MFKVGDKIMVYAKVKEVIQDVEGIKYYVEVDYNDNKFRSFQFVKVDESVVRISDDEVLKQMEKGNEVKA